jgi:replication initiation and membrane attachment protein DnaB
LPKINKENYEDITHTFNDVFDTIPCTASTLSGESIRKYNKLKLNIDSDFDMDFLIESLSENINRKVFTKDLQELVVCLAYLYDLDIGQMQKIIMTCINERGTINRDELRKNCRNYYQFDHRGVLPTVIEHTQPKYLRKPLGDNSDNAKMIYTFETTTPYDFFKSKHNGAEPPKSDIILNFLAIYPSQISLNADIAIMGIVNV